MLLQLANVVAAFVRAHFKSSVWCILLLTGLLQTGCESFNNSNPRPNKVQSGVIAGALVGATVTTAAAGPQFAPAGIVVGGIAGGAIGSYFSQHKNELGDLAHQGVQFVRVGDEIKIYMPAKYVFYPSTPVIRKNYYRTLDMLADFISQFSNKDTVRVAAYTDNAGCAKRNKALTQTQAANVSNYLWDQGIDARLMYAAGGGSDNPIASNDTPWGRVTNQRVEISFRLQPENY